MTETRFYPINKDSSYYEHMHRYLFAKQLVSGLKVLDISCGEGYGTNLLSYSAQSVIGCDIDEDIVLKAKKKYVRNNLKFQVGDCTNMPFEKESFDAIVSFETIEHFSGQSEFLTEVKRILKKDGIFIVSTPDKTIYSDERNYHNPDHVKEFTKEEFESFLNNYFRTVNTLGQRFTRHSIIFDNKYENERFTQTKLDDNNIKPMYIIAVCSENLEKSSIENSIFGDNDADNEFNNAIIGLENLEHQVLNSKITIKNKDEELAEARQTIEEKDGEIKKAQRALEEKDGEIVEARQTIEEKDGEIVEARQTIEEKDGEIKGAQRVLEEKDKEIAEARQTIEEKDGEIKEAQHLIEEKDGEIKEAQRLIKEKDDEIEKARQTLKDKNKEIEIARLTITMKEEEINKAREGFKEKDKEIDILTEEIENYKTRG